ncbi:hypothetical protein MYP_4493 [Sporocytophaga myxococcoides]|uniref:HTH araC/xylS-type domain-containing protein n=1 Tax=Sporocytophaga myxococcoides TaxID=153721 RepID=A0A098LMK4_9BACT|nr:GyrI-like domain-containing protein [Sporocytophaga myxococcoides]GAL87263.1 hypothetical protein MYP_4493 [Sporocytophaga myxococcoides]
MTKEQSINEYFFRINKVIDYIKAHLDEDLSLEKLSEISTFSKFHFHRIFKALTGQTVNNFIRNARIERSVFYLNHDPSSTIADIAFRSGFSNQASFYRTFKDIHQIKPTDFRDHKRKENSKICEKDSNNRNLQEQIQSYLATRIYNLKEINMDKGKSIQIEIKDLSELHVVYIRNLSIHMHDSETFGKMIEALLKWALPKGLVNFPETKVLTVYRSNPNDKGIIQADVCLTVPDEIEGEGIIGKTILTGGKYAVIHKEATLAECFTTWDYVFKEWFPSNGYQPDNRNFYINHLNEPEKHPQKLHIFDMCIPIREL